MNDYVLWDTKHNAYVSEIDKETDAYNVCDDVTQAIEFDFATAVRMSNILFLVHDHPFEVRTNVKS